MIATTSESFSPRDEPQMTARRRRIAHLARIVFDLMKERYLGGTNHEFDNDEDPGLLAALRACSLYTEQIGCLNLDEPLFNVEVEGIDGHHYIIRFSLFGPDISLHAARVGITKLSLPTSDEISSYNTIDIIQEYSMRLKLARVTADRAFLVGMSLVIGFMDDRGGDEQEDDDRLAPLLAQVMPTDDELREIRAGLPAPAIHCDEDEDLPYS